MPTKLTDAFKVSMQDVNKTVPNEYATVTRVNSNKTVNVKPDSNDADSDDLTNISYVVDLDLSVGDRVVLSYLNNDPNEPIIIGMLNPKSSPNVDCRSIVSVDKVESDGLVDVYRITYDKAPIYSYFSVKNGTDGQKGDKGDPGYGVPSQLSGKTVQHKVLIESKTVTNVNSVTFTGLNGDVDGEYIFESNIDITGNGHDTWVYLQPNGLGNDGLGVTFIFGAESGVGYSNESFIAINSNSWALDGKSISSGKFYAKSGTKRIMTCTKIFFSNDNSRKHTIDFLGYWLDTTTNITSFLLTMPYGTMTGTIKLYKMVDVTYPTN